MDIWIGLTVILMVNLRHFFQVWSWLKACWWFWLSINLNTLWIEKLFFFQIFLKWLLLLHLILIVLKNHELLLLLCQFFQSFLFLILFIDCLERNFNVFIFIYLVFWFNIILLIYRNCVFIFILILIFILRLRRKR